MLVSVFFHSLNISGVAEAASPPRVLPGKTSVKTLKMKWAIGMVPYQKPLVYKVVTIGFHGNGKICKDEVMYDCDTCYRGFLVPIVFGTVPAVCPSSFLMLLHLYMYVVERVVRVRTSSGEQHVPS